MTSISSGSNSLSSMLGNPFGRFDRNKDRGLDSEEFTAPSELRKPGIAVDENGNPLTEFSNRMGASSEDEEGEMQPASAYTSARLTDSTFNAMWQYLSNRSERSAQASSTVVAADDEASTTIIAGDGDTEL